MRSPSRRAKIAPKVLTAAQRPGLISISQEALSLEIRCSFQWNNCFPGDSRIRASHGNLDKRWQTPSRPPRQPIIRARIEIADFEAGHILDQWHPTLLGLTNVGTFLRFSYETKIQAVAFFAFRLQPQRYVKVTRRIAS